MLTVITGTPGAGKTVHAIAELILPMIGTTVTVTREDGTTVECPRTIYTNIRGQFEHELVELGPPWESKGDTWTQSGDNRLGLHNWHEWAKPGALIVIDEFQRLWPPRPNGAKVPPDVSALDTHRHMGVDFILITQNLMNVDRHVHGLTGRHLHVRRVANMHMAIVYEWDHASKSLMYSKAISKKPWRFNKKVFKLYHSADAHTKQPRSVPTLLYFVVAAFAAAAYFIPDSFARMAGRAQQPVGIQSAKPAASAAWSVSGPASAPTAPAAPISTPTPAAPASTPPAPAYAGCAALANVCRCYDGEGRKVEVQPGVCEAQHSLAISLPYRPQVDQVDAPRPASSTSLDTLSDIARRQGRTPGLAQ